MNIKYCYRTYINIYCWCLLRTTGILVQFCFSADVNAGDVPEISKTSSPSLPQQLAPLPLAFVLETVEIDEVSEH